MAGLKAITAVCDAVIYVLRTNYDTSYFDTELQFDVYSTRNFDTPMPSGVSLYLYRVFRNGVIRNPPDPRIIGEPRPPLLPLDLHFLLTAWGSDATLQHTIAGWMMRVIEDHPILPAGVLNARYRSVFRRDEMVEVTIADLKTEDLLRIWETLPKTEYQLSIPYVARNVQIESRERLEEGGELVQERSFSYQPEVPDPFASEA